MASRSIHVPTLLITSAFGAGLLVGACTTREANSEHCSANEGDRYCAEISPDTPVCSSGERGECNGSLPTGCVAAEDLIEGCADPCGSLTPEECEGVAESSSSGSGSTDTDAPTGMDTEESTGTDTTGPTSCAGPQDCVSPGAPYCSDDGVCVACDEAPMPELADAACAAADPLTPACAEGTCVTCTGDVTVVCDEQLQLCDTEANACVGCTEHGQCTSGACQIAEGTCFPEETVLVTVDGDAGSGADFGAIEDAVGAIEAGGFGVIVVGELDSAGTYQPGGGGFVVDGGRTIAMLAAEGERPVLQGTGANAGLRVSGAGTVVYLDELEFTLSSEQGLVVDGGFVWVDRSRIVENGGGGVLAQSMAEVTLRNCFVGGGGNGSPALTMAGASSEVVYSTFFNSAVAATPALECSPGSMLSLRNSIVVTEGGASGAEFDCPGSSVSYSAMETVVAGVGNSSVAPFPDGSPDQWFADVGSGDFGLQNEGVAVFADIAQWQDGDPATDIDGGVRPSDDGAPDYAGADIP